MRICTLFCCTLIATLGSVYPAKADSRTRLVAAYIMNNPATKLIESAYVLDRTAGAEMVRSIYHPATQVRPATLEVSFFLQIRQENGSVIRCRSTVIDRNLQGSIGPRDGYVSCIGGLLGVSRKLALSRIADYEAFLEITAMKAHDDELRIRAFPRYTPNMTGIVSPEVGSLGLFSRRTGEF